MLNLHLYMVQRISAIIMAPMVLIHIAVMIYAIQGGLSAAEILGRTKGSIVWLLFYGGFVLAVSVHAAIGLRVVFSEVTGASENIAGAFMWLVGCMLLALGAYAVWAVTV